MDSVILLLLCWRFAWAALSQTLYVPDETWQSVEVAHLRTFGRGHLTWEWRSSAIRSSLHPLLMEAPLRLLSLLGLDSQLLVVLAPKLVQAALTAAGDLALYRWVRRTQGRKAAGWLLLLLLTNWHHCYAGSRTLINSLETCLLSMALPLYPDGSYIPLAVVGIMMRPTAVVTWAPLGLAHLARLARRGELTALPRLLVLPVAILLAVVAVDSWFYGRWPTFTPWNFFLVNIVQKVSQFYGTHPAWWYLIFGLPPLLGPALPAVLFGARKASWVLLGPVLASLCLLSAVAHKEMRFLQPAVPLLLCAAAVQLADWTGSGPSVKRRGSFAWAAALLLQVPLALYLAVVHQRGVVDAALWLGRQHKNHSSLVLMPCHSTPLYSHIHNDISVRFLRCEPNLSFSPDYENEAESFYKDPAGWLLFNFDKLGQAPASVLMFDNLQASVSGFLASRGYEVCQQFFNSHFVVQRRKGHKVVVYCLPNDK